MALCLPLVGTLGFGEMLFVCVCVCDPVHRHLEFHVAQPPVRHRLEISICDNGVGFPTWEAGNGRFCGNCRHKGEPFCRRSTDVTPDGCLRHHCFTARNAGSSCRLSNSLIALSLSLSLAVRSAHRTECGNAEGEMEKPKSVDQSI